MRYVKGMFRLLRKLPEAAVPARCAGIVLLILAGFLSAIAPAHALDLFAGHRVTAQFATPSGKPMADAMVRVFAPGEAATPVVTGRTDSQGKFVFDADRDGMWIAEAHTAAEVARVTIRVGGPAEQQHTRVPTFVVIGALIVLVSLAWWFRILRARSRRRP